MNKEKLQAILRNSDILKRMQISKLIELKGGGDRVLKIKYNDNIYLFKELELADNHFILFSQNEDLECVTVIISSDDNIAEIHGIGNYEGCLMDTNVQVPTGNPGFPVNCT